MSVSVCTHLCVCMSTEARQDRVFPRDGVSGNCMLLDIGAGTRTHWDPLHVWQLLTIKSSIQFPCYNVCKMT